MNKTASIQRVMVIGVLVLLGCWVIGYAAWTGLSTRESGLKDDADNLVSEDENVSKEAEERLLNAGLRSITPLLRATKLGDLKLRIAAIDLLGEIGKRQQDLLVDANTEKVVKSMAESIAKESADTAFVIVSTSHPLRLSVARTLGEYRSEVGVELLLALLQDPEEDVRVAARNSVVKAGGKGSVILARELAKRKGGKKGLLENAVHVLVQDLVKDMLDKDAHEDIRMRAARALEDLGGARIEDAEGMCTLMLDENEALRLRKVAAVLVPDISAEKLKPLAEKLHAGLKDKNGVIQLGSAKALAGIGDPMGVDFVITCLTNDDAMIRLFAAEALNELGEKAKGEILANLDNGEAMVRAPVFRVLPSVDKEHADGRLLHALDDVDGDVRMAAAIGLGRVGSQDALRRLIMRLDDRRERVRHYCAWTIAQMPGAALPMLNATLKSLSPYDFDEMIPVIREAVLSGLKRRGIAARAAAVDEAIENELKLRRMNLPTPWSVRVEAARDGKKLPPILLDVREVLVFLATLSRMTGMSQEKLLAMGGGMVENLRIYGITFKRYDELDGAEKSPPGDVVPLRYSSFYMMADMLGVIGDQTSTEPLFMALSSDDLILQGRAAWALGMIAGRRKGDIPQKEAVMNRLLDLVQNSNPDKNATTAVTNQHMEVREKSAEALGKIADSRAKSILQTVLVCDDKVRVRTAASIAIGIMDGTERRILFDQYADALRHADPKTRAAAATKIAALGSFDALKYLLAIIHKDQEHGLVLDAAETALKTLTGRDYATEVTAKRIEDEPVQETKEDATKEGEKKSIDAVTPAQPTPKPATPEPKPAPPPPRGQQKTEGKGITEGGAVGSKPNVPDTPPPSAGPANKAKTKSAPPAKPTAPPP